MPKVSPEEYRRCGSIMHHAWKAENDAPCTSRALKAMDAMRDSVEMCKHTRWGEDYIASYGELLRKTDTWCGKGMCGSCVHGICRREKTFPFEPECRCNSGFAGKDCNETACRPACIHGSCVNETCRCPDGWQGSTCSEPVCPMGCLRNGTCMAPSVCSCPKGWTSAGLGPGCNTPDCEGGCENGAKCIAPGVCHCPSVKNVNGTELEGYSGKRCESGPQFWFGGQCKACVGEGGHWCLKDGICVQGEAPAKEICPHSTYEEFDGHTPTVVHAGDGPCSEDYRRCAEVAEPVIHWVNHDDRLLGGVCGGALKGLMQEMVDEMPRCKDIVFSQIAQDMGHLNVNQSFAQVLNMAIDKRNKKCKSEEAQ